MVRRPNPPHQRAFAAAVSERLRLERRHLGLTQSDVAERTGGVVSKAALANYETGHRSLRIDVFWALTRALGVDAGAVLADAERASGHGTAAHLAPVTVDVVALQASDEPRLAPVRRWFALRLQRHGARLAVQSVTLDQSALGALAELMGVSAAECRGLLEDVAAGARQAEDIAPAAVPAG